MIFSKAIRNSGLQIVSPKARYTIAPLDDSGRHIADPALRGGILLNVLHDRPRGIDYLLVGFLVQLKIVLLENGRPVMASINHKNADYVTFFGAFVDN
jgi:hypothetical protein